LNTEEIILKLEESCEKDYGDYGRTKYVIEKLQKDQILPKSDLRYIERMVELCQKSFDESQSETVFENTLSEDLIKCHLCELEIELDERSIRKNNFWFHENCHSRIPVTIQIHSQKIEAPSKIIKQTIKNVESTSMIPQMMFSGGLLASLVSITYFFMDEQISKIIGVCGSALFLIVFKSQILQNRKKRSSVVKIGIPGFDSILPTGFKKKSSVVISGPPGSGKTIFGLQFIYAGAKEFDEPGIYISLSQSIEEIKKDCKSFGWDIEDLIAKQKILMIDLRPFRIKGEVVEKDDSLYRGEQIPFEHLTKFIINSIKKIKAKRIVIDSISILGMQYADKFYMRQGLLGMIQSLENFDVTLILTSEFSNNTELPLEWFLTSGIIQLDNEIIDNTVKRTIKIRKLRGVEHSEQVHSIGLGNNGLYVNDS